MKRKLYLKGAIAAVVMTTSVTTTILPVSASELQQGEMTDAENVEYNGEETENAVEMQTDEAENAVEMQTDEAEMNPESGIVDKTAPVLNGLTINATSVTTPGTVEVVADVSDDISGVGSVTVAFQIEGDNSYSSSDGYTQYFDVTLRDHYYDDTDHVYKEYEDGKFHGKMEITAKVKPGKYIVDSITLNDNAHNNIRYKRNADQNDRELPEDARQISLQVSEGQFVPAKLKSLTVDKNSVTAPGTIKFTAELDRDNEEFESISVYFRQKNDSGRYISQYAYLKKDEDGKITGEMKLGDYVSAGVYTFDSFSISESGSNYYDASASDIPDAVKKLEITINNDKVDNQKPEIKNIALSSTEIEVPGKITFTVDATDDLSGIRSVGILFRDENTGKRISGDWYASEGKVKGTIGVDQYTASGIYKIESIDVYDQAGNGEYYVADNQSDNLNCKLIPESLRNLQIKVNNDGETADVVTSTISKNFLNDVKNAPENAVINVDITSNKTLSKEVQDAIKGTNKILRLNSNMIQWELNGKDIVRDTKNVYLNGSLGTGYISPELYYLLQEKNYIYARLYCGDDLPGKTLVRFNVGANVFTWDYIGESNDLYIYYYDENNKKLDLTASNVKLTKENNLEFNVTTGGYYIITTEKLSKTVIDTPSTDPSDTPDASVDYNETIPSGPSTWEGKQGTEGFVYRLYNVALTRDAEEAGLNDWNNQLTAKTKTAAEVGQGIFFSQEFQNHNYSDVQYVKLLYRTMFGREADEAGLKGWVSKLNSGMSREYVYHGFAESQEFQNLCDSYQINRGTVTLGQYRDKNEGATGYVARLYTKMLGRKYEDNGIEYWCKQYLTGKATIESIATNGFLHSQEFTNLNLSNEEFVTRMYQTFLNREPDEAGYKDWVGKLNSGEKTRDQLVYGFSLSQEFANLKKSYGL